MFTTTLILQIAIFYIVFWAAMLVANDLINTPRGRWSWSAIWPWSKENVTSGCAYFDGRWIDGRNLTVQIHSVAVGDTHTVVECASDEETTP